MKLCHTQHNTNYLLLITLMFRASQHSASQFSEETGGLITDPEVFECGDSQYPTQLYLAGVYTTLAIISRRVLNILVNVSCGWQSIPLVIVSSGWESILLVIVSCPNGDR